MARFEIEDLSFSYASAGGKLSLDRVSFSVAQGEYLVLCGRSGSGKTTLLKQLKPVLAPAGKKSGRVLFGGTDVRELSERDQAAKIGYVMQNPDDQIVTDKVWHSGWRAWAAIRRPCAPGWRRWPVISASRTGSTGMWSTCPAARSSC